MIIYLKTDYLYNSLNLDKARVYSKSKVKDYLFMKYNKNIQKKVFQNKICKNL